MDYAIGIDLGTTYSCVGVYKNNEVDIIVNEHGSRTTPSYVSFSVNNDDEEEILIGEAALNIIHRNPFNTVYDAKRLIGRNFNDSTVQFDIKHWAFNVVDDGNNKPVIKIEHENIEKIYRPEEISSMILKKIKETVESYLGCNISKAVITVPAYFNDAQRRATKDAGRIAGLEVLRIINEPTAAAIAYGLDKMGDDEKNILVFDLGGGTFDVSLLNLDGGVFTVKATAGNTHLGGEDFDNKLVVYCLKEFAKQNKNNKIVDIKKLITNTKVLSKLKTACENSKRVLSIAPSSWIEVDALYEGIDFRTQITRARFEELCYTEFEKCFEPVEQVLADSKLSKDQIDEIVLVGGSTRIPKIQSMLEKYFNKKPKNDINPDEAVAYGATIQAAILNNKNTGDDRLDSLVLIDVTPLSLGIETSGGIMTKIIPRNTIIPCTRNKIFSTYSDNQPSVGVKVFEGERELTKYNNKLGNFELLGIPPMPRGVAKINVKFEIDHNGILKVSALEESTNISHKIEIINDQNRFTSEQLIKMIEDANNHQKDDNLIKEKIKAKSDFETYLYNVRNSMDNEELKDNLGDKKCKKINEVIKKTVQWLEENINLSRDAYEQKQCEIESIIRPIISSGYDKFKGDYLE